MNLKRYSYIIIEVAKKLHEKKWSFTPGSFVLIGALIFVIGYAAGTHNDAILDIVAPKLGVKVAAGTLDLASVQNTYRQLKANFDGDISDKDLITGANKGLVEALGDKYTIYMDKSDASSFNSSLNGDIGGGIGAEIGSKNGQPVIVRTLNDTPASRSGLMAHDVITQVDGKSTDGWDTDKTVDSIRGKIGVSVKITVKRGSETHSFVIKREKIIAPSVEGEIKDGIGIMTMTRFDDTTGPDARKVAKNFKDKHVRGVILDLRNNGGGLLSAAQDVAGIWLDDKLVVSEKVGNRTTNELYSTGSDILKGVPTVVLVNEYSASASEIVTGALKDYKIATILGVQTFGKGSVQKLVDLSGGAVLKVTIAKWYTPHGKNINKTGIAPNVTVKITDNDIKNQLDPQLDAAMSRLRG